MLIDGEPARRVLGSELRTTAGSHVVSFQRPGYDATEQHVSLSAMGAGGRVPLLDCGLRTSAELPEDVRARIMVSGDVHARKVLVDGSPLPRDGWVPFGRHQLQVLRPGFEPWSEQVALKPGEEHAFEPQLQRQFVYEPADRSGRPWAYGMGAAGVVAGIAAASVYLVADFRYADWQAHNDMLKTSLAGSETWDRQWENDQRLRSIWKLDTISAGLAIGSAVALTTAVVLLFTTRKPAKPVAVDLGLRLHEGVLLRQAF